MRIKSADSVRNRGGPDRVLLLLHGYVYNMAGGRNKLKVMSWNVRGLGDPIKRTMVSTSMRKYLPAICVLQETHLTPDSLACLNFR